MSVVMPFILSLMMSGIVSLISTLKTMGFEHGIVSIWLSSWLVSWIVAFPSVLIILPIARRFASVFVHTPQA